MNNKKQATEKSEECIYCENSGVYHRQDGPDDFVDVPCLCQRSEEDGDGIDD